MGLSETLKALSDPRRRAVLELLRDGRRTAGDLGEAMRLAPSAASYHLAQLKSAGLVVEAREGTYVYYELNVSVLEDALRWICDLGSFGAPVANTAQPDGEAALPKEES